MPISFHPKVGTILICNFEPGFAPPEMVKRRPVVVLSPPISVRAGLCTVVPISTGVPAPQMPYHCELNIQLPPPWDAGPNWLKGDMIAAVGFQRLDLIRMGRDAAGKRTYREETLEPEDLKKVRSCVLNGLGMAHLTKHLV